MTVDEQLEKFFSSESFAVSGASTNREKYGNKVLRCYMQHKKGVIPVNPRADSIEGLKTVKALSDLPPSVKSISIITPPKITEMLVDEAIEHGIENIWMQPGAESQTAIDKAKKAGVNVLANGICILVVLGYRDAWLPEENLQKSE